MDKEFLLTYRTEKNSKGTFEWFDSKEELQEFVEDELPAILKQNNDTLIEMDAIHLKAVETIEL